MKKVMLVMILAIAIAAPAMADLASVTGKTYEWTAYNLNTYIPAGGETFYDTTLPTNVTGYTHDMWNDEHFGKNDGGWRIGNNTHGVLKNYSTGSNITGVELSMQNVGFLSGWNHNEGAWWLVNPVSTSSNWSANVDVWVYGSAPAVSGASTDAIFTDPIGSHYGGAYVNVANQNGYIISGLDPTKMYTFAAIAERTVTPGSDWDSASTVTIFADSYTQASTLTSGSGFKEAITIAQGFHTLGDDPTSRGYTTLTWRSDDRVMWTDIVPLADGTIRFDVQQQHAGSLIPRDAPGFTVIAFGLQGEDEDPDPDPGAIPEPASLGLIGVALLALARRRK